MEADKERKKIACTYSFCKQLFETIDGMRGHKAYAPDHFYCKKCDVDCEDWEDLTRHKVDQMAPFIEGRLKIRDEKPKHIVCEFCGENFKSFGGRISHRELMHPADQDITCPGCSSKFIRAQYMIEHIESGRCTAISERDLHASINHKHMVRQIMAEPGAFQAAISNFRKPVPKMDHLKPITDGTETRDQDQGGVSLMDELDDAVMGGYKVLNPDPDLISPNSPQAEDEVWPKISAFADKTVLEGMRSMSISSNVTSRRGGNFISSDSGVTSPSALSVADDGCPPTSSASSNAWNSGKPSAALFPTPKPQAHQDWNAIGTKLAKQGGKNTLDTQFWNRDSEDYLVDTFFDPVIQAYCCPFPACQADAVPYRCEEDLMQHLQIVHFMHDYRCKVCFKRYPKVSSLIGHVENSHKCGVGHSANLNEFIGQVTGGLLSAKYVGDAQPKIFRDDMAPVQYGTVNTKGVKKIGFEGANPKEWEARRALK